MRFLIVNVQNSSVKISKMINVDRIVSISAWKTKSRSFVQITYDIGGDHNSVDIPTKHPEELANYIMNMVLSGAKVIDLRDIDKVKFVKASELGVTA